VPWTFALRKLRLPAGKYSVVALGTDSQNVQESTVRRFNRNLRDPVTGSVDLG
jgi:hypothetical protein